MLKTYGLAVEKPHGLVALKTRRMTLQEAESARETLSTYANVKGISVLVVNFASQ